MSIPGPPVTKILPKISQLAHQVERINLEFLESNVLDRAVILNVNSPPEQGLTDVARESQMGQHKAEENEANKQNADHSKALHSPFTTYTGLNFHNLEIFYTFRSEKIDHLWLVDGARPGESGSANWVTHFSEVLNRESGYSKFWPFFKSQTRNETP